MYLPKPNEETRLDVLHELIRAHPLGLWVSLAGDALLPNHVPFMLDPARGNCGTLIGHVARANPVWKRGRGAVPDLITFQGPQAYISPSWYPSKHEHGKAVPTWNYAVVHAHGVPEFIDDKGWLHAQVSRLTQTHEAARPTPWAVGDAPEDYIDAMLGAIVGVEIPIDRLVGKWKMSQNRSVADQHGVVAGLLETQDAHAAAVAGVMRRPQP